LKERLRALDVFRGATVALMILVNNPGTWNHLYPGLAHAAWHGCTATDLVFPFFLFAVGNALAFVLPRLRAAPAGVFWRRVLGRTALIFGLGLLISASPFLRWDATGELVPRAWDTLRLMGVLQRIALAYGLAAAVVWTFGLRAAPWVAAALLLGYWAACRAFGDAVDPYSLQGWFGTAIDRAVLGAAHLYQGEGRPFDPEGLASTAPAVAQVLLGAWVGGMVLQRNIDRHLVARLLAWAAVLLAVAALWQFEMPLNKKIWSSSYVLYTTAWAIAGLALCIGAVELRQQPATARGWVSFFEAFGRNPLLVFVASSLLPRLLALVRWPDRVAADGAPAWISPLPWLYRILFEGLGSDPRLGSLLFACAHLAGYALLVLWLDRRRLYVRA
jgi:predicted acyltransferase